MNTNIESILSILKSITNFFSNIECQKLVRDENIINKLTNLFEFSKSHLFHIYKENKCLTIPSGLQSLMELFYLVDATYKGVFYKDIEQDVDFTKKPENENDLYQWQSIFNQLIQYYHDENYELSDNIVNGIIDKKCAIQYSSDHPIDNKEYRRIFEFKNPIKIIVVVDQLDLPNGSKLILESNEQRESIEKGKSLLIETETSKLTVEYKPPKDMDSKVCYGYDLFLIMYTSYVPDEEFVIENSAGEKTARKLLKKKDEKASMMLINFVNNLTVRMGKTFLEILPQEILTELINSQSDYQNIESYPLIELYYHSELLMIFNKCASNLLSLYNLSTDNSMLLSFKLKELSNHLLLDVKEKVLSNYINKSIVQQSSVSILLSNLQLSKSMINPQLDPFSSNCIFMQMFLSFSKMRDYHNLFCTTRNVCFNVKYEEEAGQDAGGLFRDSMSQIIADLFSDYLFLFVPCANSVNQINVNMDKFVPNPRLNKECYTDLYKFVGILLGASIRQKFNLPFEFPQLIWKLLLQKTVTINDIELVDTNITTRLSSLAQCTEEQFNTKFVDTTYLLTNSAGDEIELLPNGAEINLEYKDSEKYIALVTNHLLKEHDKQCEMMRSGLDLVISTNVLSIYTSEEIELLACGQPIVDIKILQEHTEYRGYSNKDDIIIWFWEIFEELTNKERSQFIRFVYGRSRLPAGNKWIYSFKLVKAGNENFLPVSHTCFFQLDLPHYSTYEITKKNILTCINYGVIGVINY